MSAFGKILLLNFEPKKLQLASLFVIGCNYHTPAFITRGLYFLNLLSEERVMMARVRYLFSTRLNLGFLQIQYQSFFYCQHYPIEVKLVRLDFSAIKDFKKKKI